MEKRNRTNKKRGNGEGSIYYSEVMQKYVGQYVEPDTKKRKTITQKRNEKVKDFKIRFNKIVSKISNGTYIGENLTSLYDILNDYIEDKYKLGITSASAYKRNKESLKFLEKCCKDFINKPIQKVTVQDVKEALPNFISIEYKIPAAKNPETASKNYSQSTITKGYNLLNKGFKIALSDRLIIFNPMDNESIKKPKSKKEKSKVEALTLDEEKELIQILNEQECNHKYKNIVLFALYTGMRIGEILALSYDDIDLKSNTITIKRTLTKDIKDKVIIGDTTKTQKGMRTIYLNNNAKAVIQNINKNKMKNIHNLLFFDYKKNTIITPSEINCYLQRLNNKYHFCNHIHTHMLRHTFATRCIESGMSAKVLQNILGHTDIKMTLNVYTDVFEQFSINESEKYELYMQKNGL